MVISPIKENLTLLLIFRFVNPLQQVINGLETSSGDELISMGPIQFFFSASMVGTLLMRVCNAMT